MLELVLRGAYIRNYMYTVKSIKFMSFFNGTSTLFINWLKGPQMPPYENPFYWRDMLPDSQGNDASTKHLHTSLPPMYSSKYTLLMPLLKKILNERLHYHTNIRFHKS